MAVSRRRKTLRPRLETLEARQMLAITATLTDGVLSIVGTNDADTATVHRTGSAISIVETGQTFSVKQVKAIDVALLDGDDVLTFDKFTKKGKAQSGWINISVTADAGGGDDTFIGAKNRTTYFGEEDLLTVGKGGAQKVNGQSVGWFDFNLIATAIRDTAKEEFAANKNKLTRESMLTVFDVVATIDPVSAKEFTTLTTLVGHNPLYKKVEYVQVLAGYVVKGTVANAHYLGQDLGDLEVGSTREHLETLVSKWYLGTDLPAVSKIDGAYPEYREVAGQLFVGGIHYDDTNDPQFNEVNQGALGDCYYLAAMAAIARKSGKPIKDMFIDNGDGTFTVRFFDNGNQRSVYYVTVNRWLPTDTDGALVYAGQGKMYNNPENELWVPLAEKAYAQVAEFGWMKSGPESMKGVNSYEAIEGGWAGYAMADILGKATATSLDIDAQAQFQAIARFNAGMPVAFGSKQTTTDPRVPSGHAYAMIGYDARTQKFELYNPWGVDSGAAKARFWLNWQEITASFSGWDYGPRV